MVRFAGSLVSLDIMPAHLVGSMRTAFYHFSSLLLSILQQRRLLLLLRAVPPSASLSLVLPTYNKLFLPRGSNALAAFTILPWCVILNINGMSLYVSLIHWSH